LGLSGRLLVFFVLRGFGRLLRLTQPSRAIYFAPEEGLETSTASAIGRRQGRSWVERDGLTIVVNADLPDRKLSEVIVCSPDSCRRRGIYWPCTFGGGAGCDLPQSYFDMLRDIRRYFVMARRSNVSKSRGHTSLPRECRIVRRRETNCAGLTAYSIEAAWPRSL